MLAELVVGRMDHQVRHWSIRYYLKTYIEGWSLILKFVRDVFTSVVLKLARRLRRLPGVDHNWAQSGSHICLPLSTHSHQHDDEDSQPATIAYGFAVFSKIISVAFIWSVSFVFDVRPGLQVSRAFAIQSYIISFLGILVGLLTSRLISEPTIAHILPGVVASIFRLIMMLTQIGSSGYIIYGMGSLAYLIYSRHFICDFALYRASVLSVSRAYQRRQATELMGCSMVFAIMMEPVFVTLSIQGDFDQPDLLPNLSRSHFLAIKSVLMVAIFGSSFLVSFVNYIIPTLTNFLLVVTSKHLQQLFNKHLARLQPIELKFRSHSDHLKSLVDTTACELIASYSCDTLTVDWPQLSSLAKSSEASIKPSGVKNPSRLSYSTRSSTTGRSQYSDLTVGSLLFLYKNLVKNLSELKRMIASYEARFGRFHLVLVCLRGLIVAQWTVAGLTQARLLRNSLRQSQREAMGSSVYLTHYAFRVGIGVVIFTVSNVYTFLRSDSLRKRTLKMRNKLFKINTDLACLALEGMQEGHEEEKEGEEEEEELEQVASGKPLSHLRGQRAREQLNGCKCRAGHQINWPELDQVWSFYDQVERMSRRVNFKFTTSSYYSKNCILMIFSREISFMLLIIQVVDIYSLA